MYSTKQLMKHILPLLGEDIKLVTFGQHYHATCIQQKDIDQDGEKEVVTICKEKDRTWLIILKQNNNIWKIHCKKQLPFKEITYFNILPIRNKDTQDILIGGKKAQQSKSILLGMYYETEVIKSFTDREMIFDKIDTYDIQDQVGLAIWIHIREEAYDIGVYLWDTQAFKEDYSKATDYVASVERYYTHLIERYPEETLYTTCLKTIQNKRKRQLPVKDTPSTTNQLELLETIVLSVNGIETQQIWLLGEKEDAVIKDLTLLLKTKKGTHLIVKSTNNIGRYKVFVGSLRKKNQDELILYTEDLSGRGVYGVYGYNGEQVVELFNTLNQHHLLERWESLEGIIDLEPELEVNWHAQNECYTLYCMYRYQDTEKKEHFHLKHKVCLTEQEGYLEAFYNLTQERRDLSGNHS